MSALNADPKGPSHYLRTKGEAESYLMTYGKRFANITILGHLLFLEKMIVLY
jgi:hypothetical protein